MSKVSLIFKGPLEVSECLLNDGALISLDSKNSLKIEDVLSVGDRVVVKVLDIDKQGKISLKKIGEQTE